MIRFDSSFLLILFTLIIMPMLITWIIAALGAVSKNVLVSQFGERSQVFIGGLGTIIHELGHIIALKLFGQRIDHAELIKFRHIDTSDTLGYVDSSWSPLSLYQQIGNYFGGIAPFYSCLFSLWLAHRLLIGRTLNIELSNQSIKSNINSIITGLMQSGITDIKHPLMLAVFILFVVMISTTGFAISISDHISTIRGLLQYSLAVLPIAFIIDLGGYINNINIVARMTNWISIMVAMMAIAGIYTIVSIVVVIIIGFLIRHHVERPIRDIRHPHIRHVAQWISGLINPQGKHFRPNKYKMFIKRIKHHKSL